MIKKIVALAATALFSLNASAGYVQYDLKVGPNGNGLEGFIVQNDVNQAIVYFDFQLLDFPSEFAPQFRPLDSEGCVCIVAATTHFKNNGPTNFEILDGFGADHLTSLDVSFARAKGGGFSYTAKYYADLFEWQPRETYAGTVKGLATKGTIDPLLARTLDEYGASEFGVTPIVPRYIGPNQIPEPTSIALFALGAAGLAGAARRRKALK